MGLSIAQRAVLQHVEAVFDGHETRVERWLDGPIEQRLPEFHVIRVGPGPRSSRWTYVSAGCWDATHDGEHGLEFVLSGGERDENLHVRHLGMIAYYHCNPEDETYRLDHGHTVPIGQPYTRGATLDNFLVSLPYPFGPELERCEWDGGHARLLWLLPITESERRFRHARDLEALEQRFEDAELRYWDLERPSAV